MESLDDVCIASYAKFLPQHIVGFLLIELEGVLPRFCRIEILSIEGSWKEYTLFMCMLS